MILSFQSTPSGGKATRDGFGVVGHQIVSIHAFRGEGDQSVRNVAIDEGVSIHAFRGEGDRSPPRRASVRRSFNPRLPGGRRLPIARLTGGGDVFQSTPSGGKATSGDVAKRAVQRFNPRLPGGRRRVGCLDTRVAACVSIHAFRGEGDPAIKSPYTVITLFQSTPSGGKATSNAPSPSPLSEFQSTPSGGKATMCAHLLPPCGVVSIHAFRGEGDGRRRRRGSAS